MLRRVAIVAVSGCLGAGAAFAAGSCGEDRGSVEVEGGGTGTGSATGGSTTGSETGGSTTGSETGRTDTGAETTGTSP